MILKLHIKVNYDTVRTKHYRILFSILRGISHRHHPVELQACRPLFGIILSSSRIADLVHVIWIISDAIAFACYVCVCDRCSSQST